MWPIWHICITYKYVCYSLQFWLYNYTLINRSLIHHTATYSHKHTYSPTHTHSLSHTLTHTHTFTLSHTHSQDLGDGGKELDNIIASSLQQLESARAFYEQMQARVKKSEWQNNVQRSFPSWIFFLSKKDYFYPVLPSACLSLLL